MRLLPLSPEVAVQVADGDFSALPPGLSIHAALDMLMAVATATVRLYEKTGATSPWLVYLSVEPATNTVVGSCGFTSGCRDGVVELAYLTFAPFEGRGHAKAMVAALLDIVRQRPYVTRVMAHTLRRDGPSCNVLRANGFRWTEPVDDPVDGSVWRWTWTRPDEG